MANAFEALHGKTNALEICKKKVENVREVA